MDNLPGNSHKSRREPDSPPKIEKQITSEAFITKKGVGGRLLDTLFPGKPEDVAEYVIWQVLIPSIKDTVLDSSISFVERMFGGDTNRGRSSRLGSRPNGGSGRSNYAGITNYTNYNKSQGREPMSRTARQRHNFDEISIETRAEAEQIITFLVERIVEYRAVTVADLYECVGLVGDFTDDKYGWNDLDDASVVRHKGRYILDLPPCILLD